MSVKEKTIQIEEKKCDTGVKKPRTLFGVELVYLGFVGIIIAGIGYLAENAARIVAFGIIDSRFHILPFISPYALVMFLVHVLLCDCDDLRVFGKHVFKRKTAKTKLYSNIVSYLLICAFVFFGELGVGNLWDAFFGVELWDYTELPLSVTQYAGLIPTLGYGTGAFLIFKFLYKPLLSFLRKKLDFKIAKIIVLTLGSLIILDTVRMMCMIIFFGEAPMYWSIKLW